MASIVTDVVGQVGKIRNVYGFLKKCCDSTINMNVNFDKKVLSIQFEAVPLCLVKRIFRAVGKDLPYCARDAEGYKPGVYKIIRVHCNSKETFTTICNHYHGKSNIPQKEIMEYLKLMYEEDSELQLSYQLLESGTDFKSFSSADESHECYTFEIDYYIWQLNCELP